MKSSRILYPATIILKHHDKQRTHGQLNLAFYFLIFSAAFLTLAFFVKLHGAASLNVNEAVFHLFRGARQPALDSAMIYITLLGQKQVVFPIILIIFAYLLYIRHFRAAAHALMLAVFGAGSVYIFKHVIQSPRPWGIANNTDTFSMPSGHTIMSVVLYIGLAFLIASSMHSKRWRRVVYTIALLITFAVGISRLYLGAHWFTDVFSAWLLGGAIVCFIIISYERAKVQYVNPLYLFLLAVFSLMLSFGLYQHKNMNKLVQDYTLEDWPVIAVSMSDWWRDDNETPANRTSLFGFPSQRINIQWVGKLDQIRATLASEGWSNPPARDWVSTLHRIADISSTQYLPMISPQYQDKKPALIMTKNVTGLKTLMVIRIWDSSRTIAEDKLPLWVGTIGIVPRTYSWVYKKQRTETPDIQTEMVFKGKSSEKWSHKMLDTIINSNGKHQKILLIRPSSTHQ